uniref:Uncharacterized protein n=1 Tax=Anguilla anguilla TaxID=7936 RepID=A0A0E9UFN0_ANGAN
MNHEGQDGVNCNDHQSNDVTPLRATRLASGQRTL